jgi:hypothetical protein
MRLDAFITTNDVNKLYDVIYYHTPQRWDNIGTLDPKIEITDWSEEIKFLDSNELDISNEVKNLPQDSGGIYVFFIKGQIVPFFETYLAYIGRAQFTNSQNLKLRCSSYYYEFFKEKTRPKIHRLIDRWGKYLYIRYLPLKDNEQIKKLEINLINGILPPFNDEIPELKIKQPEPAF